MILADTSIWIDHVRKGNADLLAALGEGCILHHPFVTAELALGSIPDRQAFCTMLGRLPQIDPLETDELLDFIAERELSAAGMGMVDAHLLASAALSEGVVIWALDKCLAKQAERLGIAYDPA